MTVTSVGMQTPGPVEYLVVEFPPGEQEFNGEMATELRRLSDSGILRVLRVLIATKDETGKVSVQDINVPEQEPTLEMINDIATLMAEDDLARITDAMSPGTVVGVVVWEDVWAEGFAAAARRAGGRAVAHGRIGTDPV